MSSFPAFTAQAGPVGAPAEVTDGVIARLASLTGLKVETVQGLLASLVVVTLLVLLRWIALRIVSRRVKDVTTGYYWRRGINYATGVLMVLLVARIWLDFLSDIGTFLGLVGAGLAIAFQDLLANVAGCMFILARRPYKVGDRIEINGQIGDVIDIRLFQTYMLECGNWIGGDQTTGRIIMVPNGQVFKSPLTNFTYGFQHIWDELAVLITFESDWKRAREILIEIAGHEAQPLSEGAQDGIRRAASRHMIFFNKLTPIVYLDVKDSGVLLTIRYLTLPRQRRSSNQRIWEAILEAFGDEPGIDFAYPTMRAYLNHLEGKSGARQHLGPDGLPIDEEIPGPPKNPDEIAS